MRGLAGVNGSESVGDRHCHGVGASVIEGEQLGSPHASFNPHPVQISSMFRIAVWLRSEDTPEDTGM